MSPSSSPRVFIDRRPIWLLMMHRSARIWLVAIGAVIFGITASLDLPGLAPDGQKALAVFAACLFLWVTEALPLMITSLLALVSFPALGILPIRETYALFGSEVTFFILGVFILASPLQRSGLSMRIALRVVNRFGRTPEGLVTSILGLTATMSCVMSCHAVAAIFLPVVRSIHTALELPRRSSFGKSLYLALAYGSVIGGTATLLGSGRAPLAVAILQENTELTISFTDWALLSSPTMIIMVVFARVLLRRMFPSEIDDISPAHARLAEEVRSLGKVSYREMATGTLILTTIGFWIGAGDSLGLATISLLAVVAAFVIGCTRWSEVEEDVNWGIVLMYGGALALGMGMLKTGASVWIAHGLLSVLPGAQPLILLGVVGFAAMWLTEGVSNAAVVALFMPPILSVAAETGIDARLVALFVALPCGYSLVMPMSTPGMALAFTGGFLRQSDTARAGTILKIASLALIILSAITIWPLLGYEV